MAKTIHTACRDCRLCTGNAFTGFARSTGRISADISTLGVTKLIRAKCKGCTHPMSEHRGRDAEQFIAVPQPATTAFTPGWYDDAEPGFERWHDGNQYTEHVRPKQVAVAPAPQTDLHGELAKLATLHEGGVLTDDEFSAAKKKLLGL